MFLLINAWAFMVGILMLLVIYLHILYSNNRCKKLINKWEKERIKINKRKEK